MDNYRSVIIAYVFLVFLLVNCTKKVETHNEGSNNTNNNNNNATPTVTYPSTIFVAAQDFYVWNFGEYYTEQFTVSETQTFIFRFSSMYKAQAAVISPAQLSSFQNNNPFTAFSLFNQNGGTQSVTLSPGTYYVGVRNTSSGSNKWSVELDHQLVLPSSDKCSFLDIYISGGKNFPSAGKYWVGFSIQSGYRYFMDGCNANCETYIIPSSELSNFQNNLTFQQYPDYKDLTGNGPGGYELKLPVGSYYLVSKNATVAYLTYALERWKKNY